MNLHRLTTLISKVENPVTVVGVGIAGGRGSLAEPVPAISLNLTHYVPEMGEISLHNCKAHKHLTYIAQVTPDARLLMWGEDVPNVCNKKMPTHVRHPLYLNDKMLFFTDGTSWTRYLATRDFVFGSRIHGNIAAIISGTPAVVIAHDARTLELARFHNLPHIEVSKLNGRIDAREFFELADFDAFNSCQRTNFAGFADFLREHRITHVYEPGQENPSYDARISALPTIPAIRALTSKDALSQCAAYARLAESRSRTSAGKW